jgi:hypothetical protein
VVPEWVGAVGGGGYCACRRWQRSWWPRGLAEEEEVVIARVGDSGGVGGHVGRRRRKKWLLAGLAGEGEEEERQQAPPVRSALPPLESDPRCVGRRRAPSPFTSGVRQSSGLAPLLPPSPVRCVPVASSSST